MNQRLTRKEMKRDEFAEALERTVGFAERNRMRIIWAGVGVLVALGVGIGVHYYLQARAARAETALGRAMKVLEAPVGTEAQKGSSGDERTFPDNAARRKAAEEDFQQVQKRYSGTEAADVASVYLARLAVEDGDLDRARKLWEAYLDEHPDDILAGESWLNLMALDRQQGRAAESIASLNAMLEKDKKPIPDDAILFELAKSYVAADRKEEAKSTYQRLLEEYPQSAYAGAAQAGLRNLGGTPPPPGGALGGVPPISG